MRPLLHPILNFPAVSFLGFGSQVTWVNRRDGLETTKAIEDLFVMIGAQPNTSWLKGVVALDEKGFVITGSAQAFDNTPYGTAVGKGSVVVSDVRPLLDASPGRLKRDASQQPYDGSLGKIKVFIPVASRFIRGNNTDWRYAARNLPALSEYCPDLEMVVQQNAVADLAANIGKSIAMARSKGLSFLPSVWSLLAGAGLPGFASRHHESGRGRDFVV